MITINQERFDRICTLYIGKHTREQVEKEATMCVVEARNYVRERDHSDHEPKESYTIGALLRALNDRIKDDAKRTALLLPFVAIEGTQRGTGKVERRRSWMVVDWDVRWRAPRLLRAIGLPAAAMWLETLPEISSDKHVKDVREVCREIGKTVRKTRDEARKQFHDRLDALAALAALDAFDARDALAVAVRAARAARDALAVRDALDARAARDALDALDALAALAALDAFAAEGFKKIFEAARTGGYLRARAVADEVLGPEYREVQRKKWEPIVDEMNAGLADLIRRLCEVK